MKTPQYPLLVYTDLDGTLLDHDSYSHAAALPALQRLHALHIPVIPVTSKTLAELDSLTLQLGLTGPCIAENGGLIAVPPGYFPARQCGANIGRYEVEFLSADYPAIVATLRRMREASGYRFQGFADLSADEISRLTGLSVTEAELAGQRLCSEPLVWHDTEEAFERFAAELETRQLTVTRGGRFWHIMGRTDKARAIRVLDGHFLSAGLSDLTTIALGDSPNDIQMLLAADVAVVVRRKDGSHLTLEHAAKQLVRTQGTGPEGWNEFVQAYLDPLDARRKAAPGKTNSTHQRTRHG